MKDLTNSKEFIGRHIGPSDEHIKTMLSYLHVKSLEELIQKIVPDKILEKEELKLDDAISEDKALKLLKQIVQKNKIYKNYLGAGYYGTITPNVILRNILENPGWYTAYTPYQPEVAQGRLEMLLNFQQMIIDLTKMDIANASLLDEGTAAAEAVGLCQRINPENLNKIFISNRCNLQTIDVVKTRAEPFGLEIIVGDNDEDLPKLDNLLCAIVQYPDSLGTIYNLKQIIDIIHNKKGKAIVVTDLLALTLIKPPGEMGADIVVGNSQRFGVPMGYGGPHAAFFATKDEFKRAMPGRIIGVSVDRKNKQALRMALYTREQRIRREKATSNICTAQVLLSVMAGMYAVYHGPKGLTYIADKLHAMTATLANELEKLGLYQSNTAYFDTIVIKADAKKVKEIAEKHEVNFYYVDENTISISLNETTSIADINKILTIFANAINKQATTITDLINGNQFPKNLERKSSFLTHDVFNNYHSETALMRYIKKLERKDLALNHSMISLGSCTMKLNAASEMLPLSTAQWNNIHPFAPIDQAQGYMEMLSKLEQQLNVITGFAGTTLQPNSGAQGEYAGLMVIRAYHQSRGDHHRNIALIPASAHGTNPASAAMAGMQVVVTKTLENGNIDVNDLREKAILHADNLSCLMVTYPSTHGVYEAAIIEITKLIHENGGQVYMDGANMNAQVGLTNPATIGADVCHLNLHKTFAIPHGGGGPGVGPICVAPQLVPFLPSNPIIKTGGDNAITAISAAPWGSALACLISYGYICMLGAEGLTNSTIHAILNANYIKERLNGHYTTLYSGEMGRAAHEMIIECRPFKEKGIEVTDIAKRLMDYGFHAPTVSFPVAGTLMIEPTESEDLAELDRFCDAMISIRKEIEAATAENANNVLKNSPHTLAMITTDNWIYPYTREQAAFPLDYIAENKFWPTVRRVDEAYGDRNLVCSCAPIEAYM